MVITLCSLIRKCPILFGVLPLTWLKDLKREPWQIAYKAVLSASLFNGVFFLNEKAQITEQYPCYFMWSGPLLTSLSDHAVRSSKLFPSN